LVHSYNVIALTSTVIAILFGSVLQFTTRVLRETNTRANK